MIFTLLTAVAGVAQGAPLPMPAVKQSQSLAARYYGGRPVNFHNTPCWDNGRQGVLENALCVFVDVTTRDVEALVDGIACVVDGHGGVMQDDVCVVPTEMSFKRTLLSPYNFGWFHPGPFRQGDQCWRDGQQGYITDSICVLADLHLKRGLLDGILGSTPNRDFTSPYYGPGHRFGWYHPGPYLEGDRCYQDGRHGIVKNAICIIADVHVGKRAGRYENYYPFGWFHPGPFRQGDRCFMNGRYGTITDSLCILVDVGLDLNLKRDGPQYRGEPYFEQGYSFGWFHQGLFSNGDICWQNGRYGTVKDTLCVILDINLNLKRGLEDAMSFLTPYYGPGHQFGWYHPGPFVDGDKCIQDGRFGKVKNGRCVQPFDLATFTAAATDAHLFSDNPTLGRGQPCVLDGKSGVLRDAVCVIADVKVTKRGDDNETDDADVEDEGDDFDSWDEEYYEDEQKRDFLFGDGQYADNGRTADAYDGYWRDAYHRGDRFVDGVNKIINPGGFGNPLDGLFKRQPYNSFRAPTPSGPSVVGDAVNSLTATTKGLLGRSNELLALVGGLGSVGNTFGPYPLKGATTTPYGGITDGGFKSMTHGGFLGALTNGGSVGGLTNGGLDGATGGLLGQASGVGQPLAGGLLGNP